jgi:hypothetical protein
MEMTEQYLYLLECDSGDDEGQPEMSAMKMAEQNLLGCGIEQEQHRAEKQANKMTKGHSRLASGCC